MDNPQHYQPLSHALHPPSASTTVQPQATYTPDAMYQQKASMNDSGTHREEEEEEEEEEDDDDEGMVEEQLSRNEPDNQASNPASPPDRTHGSADNQNQPPHDEPSSTQEPEPKRRPGRPRGSKNRRPRAAPGPPKQDPPFQYQGQPMNATVAPPQQPEVNSQNQQYYEFQWRVLNLCAEFYTAAEELVKGTPPLVVAQCYHMGPGIKVDPLTMLNDAKRICDTLLANPSQLVSQPPPPIYPIIPTLYQAPSQPQAPPVASTSASSSKPTSTVSVITNPQTFVVPLGAQPAYPHYPVYAPPPAGQYPTTPYYHQYAAYHPTAYYPQQVQTTAPQQPAAGTSTATTSVSAPPVVATTTSGAGTMQGAWSDEETERLKKLAEDSKSVGTTGEIEWDWVVHQWGHGRTRHQILIKATSLGLKESSSRGVKRRRENEGTDAASPSVPPTPTISANPVNASSAAASASPSQSHSASTPTASPALQNQQRPSSSKGHGASTSSGLPYPMPTVARDITSPVIPTDQQRTSYYRPRPTQGEPSPKPPSTSSYSASHHYMYQPNGGTASSSRSARENGK
ncbi:hypothetical protein BDQ12DRAFT_485905 [Crucibulum laeve]|uniref:Myb-like domain-containing protein n=1 Tax=Crucibulum laeve TaxID=68775 RepID=A0A5C3M8H3_9AGAR|nr:hypothetical protein BDQ12DRAFT_485905 [Crucibulum laeve]